MKATYNGIRNKIKASHRKEKHFYKQFTVNAIVDGYIKEVACLRLYRTKERCYACLWVDNVTGGSGYAGCGGYDKASAAASEAIRAAGYSLEKDIDGRGENAIIEALNAVGECCLPGNKTIKTYIAHS